MKIKMTPAQMTALECAGVLEMPEGDGECLLCDAIYGAMIHISPETVDQLASTINDMSNAADERSRDDLDDDRRKWARSDAAVLANLYAKVLRLCVCPRDDQ